MDSEPNPSPSPERVEQQTAYIQELERRLAEAQANVHALVAAQIDAVLESGKTTPLLLREAQAALQRTKAELEQKVAERTAELLEANVRLVEANRELAEREEALRDSEGRFRAMADGTPVMIWVTDEKGDLVFINRAGVEFFGTTLKQMQSVEWKPLIHPDDSTRFVDEFMICLKERRSFRTLARIRRYDGEWRWIDTFGQPRFSESGEFLGMAGSGLDITERRLANEALRISDARLRIALGHVGLTVFSQDRELRYTWDYNPHAHFQDTERIGKTDADLLPAEDAARLTEIKKQVLESGERIHQEIPVTIGGQVYIYDFVIEPICTGDGEVTGILGSALDITERKRAAEALLQSQNQISRLVNTSFEGIWSVDRQGNTTFVNQRAAEILGYTLEEIQDRNAFEFLMPKDIEAGRQTLARIMAGESGRVEAHARRKDGSEAVLLTSYSPIFDEHGSFQNALAMFSDITERKQAEQDLKEYSRQLREHSEHLEARVQDRTEELVNLQRILVDRVEVERLWVSQELHDGPMQEIYGLMYRLSLLKDDLEDPELQAEITNALDKLKEINEDLRFVTRELRPSTLTPFGLEKAIREHSERFDLEHPELELSLNLTPDGNLLPEHVRLTLFRIYQSAMTNVIRHAQAKHISVNFSFDDQTIVLEIQDDGKGFNAPKRLRTLAAKGHFGLPGAAERAEAIGGRIEVESAPDKGTRLRVIAPRGTVG